MKKIRIGTGILIALIFISWAFCEIGGSDYYNYQGYITEIYKNERGETVITTLSETTESTFIFKWYTKRSASSKHPIAVGDRILLSTTRNSNINIKKMKTQAGYSTEGKLIYIEGLSTPFVLTKVKETQAYYLVCAVKYSDNTSDGPKTGDTVRIYHAYPVATSVSVESSVVITEGSVAALTPEDIAFVKSQGYTLQTE